MVIGYMRAFYYQSLPQCPLPRFQRPNDNARRRRTMTSRDDERQRMTATMTCICQLAYDLQNYNYNDMQINFDNVPIKCPGGQ